MLNNLNSQQFGSTSNAGSTSSSMNGQGSTPTVAANNGGGTATTTISVRGALPAISTQRN